MRAYFSRRYKFSASHRLHTSAFTEDRNRDVYGKCNNPHGHGHNYVIEVTVGGSVDAETGMVCDMVELDACVRKEVVERFDHTNLNLDPLFKDRVPTTENLCMEMYQLLAAAFQKAEIVRLRVEETSNNSFEYPANAPFAAGR
ncbi:6-carboxytetrahydropterin synthase [Alloacidobacterium dinghuense]|uniref:6-carboxy-5,6,7,8-tetrahydropterin synthase n=1 Tax=Alloacidobacterium dinghuense TaxID=2763107 RepID=A0A7G8BLG4_9BACT|nr:6-carboxytetrahydropterin synthase [Alloacidobacterium dinghuense]QNI33384.1 6-carboxytetrahydropterin synthase [Alloacidobacterium dinghuense]